MLRSSRSWESGGGSGGPESTVSSALPRPSTRPPRSDAGRRSASRSPSRSARRFAVSHITIPRPDKALILKIGIHTGASIAVTLNDRLDYFGQTVNIAARVQGLAEAMVLAATQDLNK